MNIKEWDVYATPTGRKFYYNPVTEESRWKPPRQTFKKKKKSSTRGKVPYLPRSPNSVYAYGCEKQLDDEPVEASSSSEENETVMSNSFPTDKSKALFDLDRCSVVRDSIR